MNALDRARQWVQTHVHTHDAIVVPPMTTDDSLVRTLLIVIVAILLLPILGMVIMMPLMGMWGGHMWNGTWTGGGWMWIVMSIVPLLVFLGIGYLLYSAVRAPGDHHTDPAIDELRSAYARGDLTEEEFQKRREQLEQDR